MNRLLIKKQAKASLKGKWGKAIGFCLVASIVATIIPAICFIVAGATSSRDAAGNITLLSTVGAIFVIIGYIVVILTGPLFAYATTKVFLKINRGEDFSMGNIFDGFKEKPGKSIGTGIVAYIVIWLCYAIPACIGSFFLYTVMERVSVVWRYVISNNHGRLAFIFQHLGPRGTVAFMFFTIAVIFGVIARFMYSLIYYVRVDNPDMGVIETLRTSRKIMHGRKLDLAVLCVSFIGWFFVCGITCGIGCLWLAPYIQANIAAFYDAAKDDIIE